MKNSTTNADNLGAQKRSVQPFVMSFAIWGHEYTRRFSEFGFASLMSPGNIPTILRDRPVRLFIGTTARDREILEARLRRNFENPGLTFEFREMVTSPRKSRHDLCKGLLFGIDEAISLKGLWGFSQDDWVWADGSLSMLVSKLTSHRAVLGLAFRLDEDEAEPRLGQLRDGQVLECSAEKIEQLILEFPHVELESAEITASTVPSKPSMMMTKSPNGDCAVVRCHDWAELGINFAFVSERDSQKFRNEYVGRGIDFKAGDGLIVQDFSSVYLFESTKELAVCGFSAPFDVSHRGGVAYGPESFSPTFLQVLSRYQQHEFVDVYARYLATRPFFIAREKNPEFCRRAVEDTQDLVNRAATVVWSRSPAATRGPRRLKPRYLLPRAHPRRVFMGLLSRISREFSVKKAKPRN